ncbi:MAG: geranylgeranyl reductase family protein [Actinomycetota bacterium]
MTATGKTTEVDVLVVGAGPGGSATAYHLAKHGVNVLSVDKARFPREKVCGDGLTPRGVRVLQRMGVDPTDPAFVRVDGLRSHAHGFTITLPWPDLREFPSYGVVRTRLDFDHLLAQRAQKAGAMLWEEAEARTPRVEADQWVTGATVIRGGEPETVRARFVVAADGGASRFAGGAGVRRDPGRPLGIAARRYYRSPRAQDPVLESWLDLDDRGRNLPGYGWVFPLGDGVLNVGAGLLNTYRSFRDVSAQRLFDVFVRSLPADWELTEENALGPLLSGPLPMGMNRRPLARPGMLVVGDAGGIVNPFNGEGIAYAMESGELAADLLYEALVKDRPAVAHLYPTVLRQRYGRYFKLGRGFVKAIGDPRVMRLATKYGLPRRTLMAFLLRVMANLSDGRDGDVQDKMFWALERIAREE